jgi:hypothetical protein
VRGPGGGEGGEVNPAWVAIVDESSPRSGDDIGHSPTRSTSAAQATLALQSSIQDARVAAAKGGRRGGWVGQRSTAREVAISRSKWLGVPISIPESLEEKS